MRIDVYYSVSRVHVSAVIARQEKEYNCTVMRLMASLPTHLLLTVHLAPHLHDLVGQES
jgi:hypothetical protein